MPTFDFQCKACQTVFEHTRPFGSKEHPKCPLCKSKRTEKLLTPPAIHFKGTGFYKTDSGTKSAPKKKEEPAKDTSTSNTKLEAKVEPKKGAPKSPASAAGRQNPSTQSDQKKL